MQSEVRLDPDVKARIIGVHYQMSTFSLLFSLKLCECVLKTTDNLSRALQKSSLSAAEAQHITSLTITTLSKMRTDEAFHSLIWFSQFVLLMVLNNQHPLVYWDFFYCHDSTRHHHKCISLEIGKGSRCTCTCTCSFYRMSIRNDTLPTTAGTILLVYWRHVFLFPTPLQYVHTDIHMYLYILAMTHHSIKQAPSISVGRLVFF